MLILHGIYQDGKIEIREKELPAGKAEVEIRMEMNPSPQKEKLLSLLSTAQNKKLFKNIKDPVAWQRKIRNEW